MRIALAQLNSTPGSFDATVARMLGAADEAAACGADLVIFPATVLAGAYPTYLSASRAFMLDVLDALEGFAARTPVRAVVPAYVFDGQTGYTEFFLCEDGMAGPLRMRDAQSSAAEAPSLELVSPTVQVGGVSVRLVSGDTATYGADADVDVTCILPTFLAFCEQDSSSLLAPGLADSALRGLVEESPGWLAVLQGVGGYDDVVLAGGSFAASPEGELAAVCPSFSEGLATFDVDPRPDPDDVDAQFAAAFPLVAPERPARLGPLVSETPVLTADQRTGFLWEALVLALRDYVRKCGFSQVIVGLSGGIDSSVVAALAADALGAERVLGVLMPGPFSSASSVTDAEALADALGIPTRTVPIGALYEAACPLYADALGGPFEGLARENLQARLRGMTLMSLANACGALVLNTGNKSEAGMGYSTLYGDTVGAFAPLTDVYKGRVYDLARWRNARESRPPIPESVLTKAPSAELSENQTDEASFGACYDEIDRVLEMHLERGMSAGQIVAASGIEAEVVERVLRACQLAEFKRRQEPMGPLVSSAPFVDRGWPVVLGWRDRSARDPEMPARDPEGEESVVTERLERMLVRMAQPDRAIGMLGDVAFATQLSGRGPEMDDVMGMPVFSKN